jgi:hypothetical protein
MPEAFDKALKILGKGFVECHTRQRRLWALGKALDKESFAE